MKTLSPRTYNTIPFWTVGVYRRFCWPWWKDVLDPRSYWYDLHAFWQRGRRGWADRDCFSLDYYIAGWMGDALHYLHSGSYHAWEHSTKGQREYQRMIEAFDAARHVHWECSCWQGLPVDQLKAHDDKYMKHWQTNAPLFLKHFFRLWQ